MKKTIIIVAIAALVSLIFATTMTVHTTSGAVDFEISEITSITFENGGSGGDFEWCTVPAGDYTYGENDEIQNIDYDFQIMKYEVTNQQYVDYLEEALNAGNITVTTATVEGYYEGDQNWNAGYL